MHPLLRQLEGSDLRSIGKSNAVVAQVIANPRLFGILFGGLQSANAVLRARAADAIEKITLQHPEYLRPYRRQLIGPLARVQQKEVRWHLAQMFPRIPWKKSEQQRVVDILATYLEDESSIVKTFAMQALADLAESVPELRSRVLRQLQERTNTGTPAMKARGRKLLARLGGLRPLVKPHRVTGVILVLLGVAAGCGLVPRADAADPPDGHQLKAPSQHGPQVDQAAAKPARAPQLEDAEEQRGPFTLAGQTYTVFLRYKRLPGKSRPDSQALASLEIRDATGEVQYQTSFPHAFEKDVFLENCSADVRLLSGSNGAGLLIASGCLPSAPLSGGPWQIVGVVGGKLAPLGKPLVTQGELDAFVPGAISQRGNLTQILPDVLKIRVWTGYFFVSVPVRIDWGAGKLALGQRCLHQTGHGMAEEGCEMPVDEARLAPREQELTFVRMFHESNPGGGPPAHVVVKKDSKVAVVAGKVVIFGEDRPEAMHLTIGEDVWVKVRIDGKEGWIHTPEDLNAIGLFASG